MRLAPRYLAAATLATSAAIPHAAAADWQAEDLALPGPVAELRQQGDAAFLGGAAWWRVAPCGPSFCLDRAMPPAPERPAAGIPHGGVARGAGPVGAAWYAAPTGRYGHGVLGDRIEAGALVVAADGGRHRLELDADQVFEDLTPRLADLDGDGRSEIVTIRSGLDVGAAVAVYVLREGKLREIAATPPAGRPNRWLNVAGIADFTGDGRLEIALVRTPHIGGVLELWGLRAGGLQRLAAAPDFSNHAIGSRELGLSAVADLDGDGVADLALPDAGRTSLRLVSFAGGAFRRLAEVALGAPVVTAIGLLATGRGPALLMGLEDGRAVVVRRAAGAPRR